MMRRAARRTTGRIARWWAGIPWMSRRMPLAPLLAELAALLRRHLLPALIVVEHSLTLRRREFLKAMVALQELLALLRRQGSEAAVGFLQLGALRGRKLPPAVHRLEHL